MDRVSLCLILNLILMLTLTIEAYKDYDIILDSREPIANRRRYTVKLIIAYIAVFIATCTVYRILGVDGTMLKEIL